MGSITPEYPNPNSLKLRFLMHRKEAEYIIGHNFEIIKYIKHQSGARIGISECFGMERIVTIIGTTDNIYRASTIICYLFQEKLVTIPRMKDDLVITFHIILPHAICGLLIGKGGQNIKYMKQVSGSHIQVSDNFLPNSSDKTVSVKGKIGRVTNGIYVICEFLQRTPNQNSTVPYSPNSEFASDPVILVGNKAYMIQGKYAVPVDDQIASHIKSLVNK